MPAAKRIRVIVNPSARSGRGKRDLARAGLVGQRPDGAVVEWLESRSAAHLQELVLAAQDEEIDVLGLAGGDGTVTLALNALAGPNRVPLGLLPVGSGNDFARDAGVPGGTAEAFATLVSGTPRWVDAIRVTPGGQGASERSCCVASVGLDEVALRIIHGSIFPRSKANIYAALRALLSYRPRSVRLAWEGGSFSGEVMFAAVTNTRSYGGGFRVSPAARIDDGLLDLCIVKGTSRARLLASFPRILKGTHGVLPDVILAQSPWVRVDSIADTGDAPLPVSIDGELPHGATPIELRCEPRALQVLVPAGGPAGGPAGRPAGRIVS